MRFSTVNACYIDRWIKEENNYCVNNKIHLCTLLSHLCIWLAYTYMYKRRRAGCSRNVLVFHKNKTKINNTMMMMKWRRIKKNCQRHSWTSSGFLKFDNEKSLWTKVCRYTKIKRTHVVRHIYRKTQHFRGKLNKTFLNWTIKHVLCKVVYIYTALCF